MHPTVYSVPGVGRLIVNSHDVNLVLLSSAKKKKKKGTLIQKSQHCPISSGRDAFPMACAHVPVFLFFCTPASPLWGTRGEPPARGHYRHLKKGTQSVSTLSAGASVTSQ